MFGTRCQIHTTRLWYLNEKNKHYNLKTVHFGFVKTIHVQYIEFLFVLLILNIIFTNIFLSFRDFRSKYTKFNIQNYHFV